MMVMSARALKKKLLQTLCICFILLLTLPLIRIITIRYIYSRYSDKIYLSNLTASERLSELYMRPLYEISSKCPSKVYLLVLVASSRQNIERRNVIRTSWVRAFRHQMKLLKSPKSFQGNQVFSIDNIIKVVFLIGRTETKTTIATSILEEANKMADLVIGNFTDSYRNLTRKTRIGLEWASQACPSKFILKTDDDMFVNMVWLVEWLKGVPDTNLYTGRCPHYAFPRRNKGSIWYVSHEEYPATLYPPYCMGGGYIISQDVLRSINMRSRGRQIFPYEDIYIGMIAHELGITVRDESDHFWTRVYQEQPDDCQLKNLFIVHEVTVERVIQLTDRVSKAISKCKNVLS